MGHPCTTLYETSSRRADNFSSVARCALAAMPNSSPTITTVLTGLCPRLFMAVPRHSSTVTPPSRDNEVTARSRTWPVVSAHDRSVLAIATTEGGHACTARIYPHLDEGTILLRPHCSRPCSRRHDLRHLVSRRGQQNSTHGDRANGSTYGIGCAAPPMSTDFSLRQRTLSQVNKGGHCRPCLSDDRCKGSRITTLPLRGF